MSDLLTASSPLIYRSQPDWVRDDAWRMQCSLANRARKSLLNDGWALIDMEPFGFGQAFCQHLVTQHFAHVEAEAYPEDVFPPGRKRACDVVIRGHDITRPPHLQEAASVTLVTAPGTLGNHPHGLHREYPRVRLAEDPKVAAWIFTFLDFLPIRPAFVPVRGLIRFDLSEIAVEDGRPAPITSPDGHSDGFPVNGIFVARRVGEGAETRLHDPYSGEVQGTPLIRPGHLLLTLAACWLHGTNDLLPDLDGNGLRQAVLINIA